MTATRNLLSIGEAARQLGVSLERLATAAQAAGVVAVDTRDGVPYLDARDVELLRARINGEGRDNLNIQTRRI